MPAFLIPAAGAAARVLVPLAAGAAGAYIASRDNKQTGEQHQGGVFWRGQDNQVWVSGPQGTNPAGTWDSNSYNYWTERGFQMILDPNSSVSWSYGGSGGPVSGGGGGTGGRGGYRTAAQPTINRDEQINLINQAYNTQLSNFQNQLRSLDSAQAAAETQVRNQYGSQLNKLETQLAQGRRNLIDSTNRVTEQKVRGLGNILNQFRQAAMGYQNQLGAMGAGDSSAERQLMQAVGAKASTNRANVMSAASDQYRGIQRQSEDLEMAFEQNKRDLDNWRDSNLADIAARFTQQRAEIQNAMASATAEQQQSLLELDAANVNQAILALRALEAQYASGINALTQQYQQLAQPTQYSINPALQEYMTTPINPGRIAPINMNVDLPTDGDIITNLIRRRRNEE